MWEYSRWWSDQRAFVPEFYVRCMHNDGYPSSLSPGRVYPAAEAMSGLVRVLDDSNAAYYYPMHHFEVTSARI